MILRVINIRSYFMDNNSGETPNPLNPGGQSAAQPAAAPKPSPTPTTPTTEPAAPTSAPVESLDPTGRPMEQNVATAEPVKKSKAGIIAAIVAGCVLLIGGIIAAIIIMMGANKGDAVAAAMQKIMNGEAPKNVAIDGTIDILLNNENIPFKRININLDSDIMVGSMINTSSAVLTFTDNSDNDYSVEFEEVYAANDDLYFKIEGASDAIKNSGILNLMGGVDTDDEDTAAELDAVIGLVKSAEGVYLRISSDEMNALKQQSVGNEGSMSCVTDLVSNLDKNTNSAIQLYSKYPFIASTDKNIPIASKQNPIYQIWVDSEQFYGYATEMQNTQIAQSLYECMGLEDNVTITEEDIEAFTSKMPKVYAEVNADNNFTRLYFESDISNGAATATVDLGFSYPTNINVSEPVEYTDFSEFLQTIFKSMYSGESANVVTVDE